MSRDQIVLLQKVIDYIEENLREEVQPEKLAEMAGYSLFHFSRIFQKHTGYPLMDYVQKRRLQHALYELAQGRKIVDIAFDYDFQTHAGFTKAFKKCFGSPPALYKQYCPVSMPPKVNLASLEHKQTGGMVMQPKLVTLGPIYVAGKTFEFDLKSVRYTRDAPVLWDEQGLNDGTVETELYAKLAPVRHGEFCINLGTNEDSCTYFFAVECEADRKMPAGMQKRTLPAADYAIFRTPLVEADAFAQAIRGTWRYILEEWLPQSDYEIDAHAYDFEYYDEYCHYWDYKRIYMEIFIPIRKRA